MYIFASLDMIYDTLSGALGAMALARGLLEVWSQDFIPNLEAFSLLAATSARGGYLAKRVNMYDDDLE